MYNKKQSLDNTLELMGNEFSSAEFYEKLRNQSMPECYLKDGTSIRVFLKKYCIQITKKQWSKKEKNTEIPIKKDNEKINFYISELKKEGYKIMKEVIEFREI